MKVLLIFICIIQNIADPLSASEEKEGNLIIGFFFLIAASQLPHKKSSKTTNGLKKRIRETIQIHSLERKILKNLLHFHKIYM
jgi:hypothetical protein